MTTIILIGIIWVWYGLFAAYQTDFKDEDKPFAYVSYAIFAPVVFTIKAIYGAIKRYK